MSDLSDLSDSYISSLPLWSLEKVKIIKYMDFGATSKVFLGEDLITDKLIVVKVVKVIKHGENMIKLISQEIAIHSKLNHPNIIKFYGSFKGKKIYLTLEYAENGNLYNLDKINRTEQKLVKYIKSIFKALIYLHKQDIIHNDIKLENILLMSNDTVKLADFGLSIAGTSSDRRGTLMCMSPEEIMGMTYDHRVDIWSTGILMYEFLSMKLPFHSINNQKMYIDICSKECKYPSYFSKKVSDLISLLIEKRAKDRISLLDALEHVLLSE